MRTSGGSRDSWEALEERDGWSVWHNGRMKHLCDTQEEALAYIRRNGGGEAEVTRADGGSDLAYTD